MFHEEELNPFIISKRKERTSNDPIYFPNDFAKEDEKIAWSENEEHDKISMIFLSQSTISVTRTKLLTQFSKTSSYTNNEHKLTSSQEAEENEKNVKSKSIIENNVNDEVGLGECSYYKF